MTNREKIKEIIINNSCGITVRNILEKIGKIDKTTVYRNLEKLLVSGEILEQFSNSGEKTYSLKENHHHHFTCNKCSKKINIGCILDEKIKEFEKTFNIVVNNHSFLLSGFCEKCR